MGLVKVGITYLVTNFYLYLSLYILLFTNHSA